MKYLYLLLLTMLICFSCKEDNKDRIARLVAEWQGKEIIFPDNPTFTRFVNDTVNYRIPASNYKVLIYVDSIGCTSCKLQLHKWKELIAYTDSVTGGSVPFLFFFQSKDDKELRYMLKRDNFEQSVCIDHENRLEQLNHFPADITFQTFLLDKNNKVVVIGNPIHNLSVKELYMTKIAGATPPVSKLIRTTAKTAQSNIDFGIFDKNEVKTATVEIKNTGSNPLVIVDVSTTCGCTTVTYDKESAKLGELLRVRIKMTPKNTGFFDETVTIKCNTNQPVKVKIRGNVR